MEKIKRGRKDQGGPITGHYIAPSSGSFLMADDSGYRFSEDLLREAAKERWKEVNIMKRASRCIATGAVLILLIGGVFSPAWAQTSWTAIGSTGTTDNTDIANLLFTTTIASISPNAPERVAVTLRYSVVGVDGLLSSNNFRFTARFKDNGLGARVVLSLRKVNIETGITETIAALDSNDYPPSASFQTQSKDFGGSGDIIFDFTNNAYYVEADLRKRTPGSFPALMTITISPLFQL